MPTTEELEKHLSALSSRCEHMARAIAAAGLPTSRRMEPGFATLIRIIIDQQVSAASGRAIWNKLAAATGGDVSPTSLLRLGEAGLRVNGFSGQKARYALGAAQAAADGALDFAALESLDDPAVRAELVKLKGIGNWSADIYLMFGMGRHDIWPVGDLALQYSAQALMRLRRRPTPQRLEKIGERWAPYRSSAALMLWRFWHHHVEAKRAAKPKKKTPPARTVRAKATKRRAARKKKR